MIQLCGCVRMIRLGCVMASVAMVYGSNGAVLGDEGMWLFNNPPKKILKDKYGFEPDQAWFEHLQRSSVRFNNGASGSFVSSNGLVLTNHHVGADALQKLSSKDKNYLADGFYAKTQEQEIKCLDLELNVLMSIEDVTERVNAAVPKQGTLADAEKARRAIMNTIEQESTEKTGLRSDVITLYHGGLYHLYRYKKYTDVRLVFAPELDIAFFGGDPDNFEYPRYDLDICIFRVYEKGKPAKIEHYLPWSSAGAADGELIFVSGHPFKTDRLDTVAHLSYLRDLTLPSTLIWLRRREILLLNYSERSDENARRAREELFNVQNSRKARVGQLDGLQDPAVISDKRAAERALRDAVKADDPLRTTTGPAWNDVIAALKTARTIRKDLSLLEEGRAFYCRPFTIARTLVRMAEEDGKPNAERLREFRQSNRESLEQMLFSAAPIYDDLERVKLADSLSMFVTEAGANNGLVVKVLAGRSPRDRAAELIHGTHLKDVAVRRELAKGGKAAIAASKDPMIQLALLVDEPARNVRRTLEEQVDEPLRQAYAKIAKARFAVSGTGVYPDATFTLRLAFGVVKGYDEMGQPMPPWTTLGGAYQHSAEHNNRPPFNLPKRWLENKSKLNLDTPFNFVSTADIIGGNSGSPVVNRQGQFVGIIFDGNLESLVWDFIYTEKVGRALSVHSAAIEEALRKLYDASALADELGKQEMKKSPVHLLGTLLVVAVFIVAFCLLVREFHRNDLTYAKIRDSILQIPGWHFWAALGLTVINYGVLVGYDYLAFHFAEVPISLKRITFAALAGYSFSYNFGATLAGAPLRYRLYSSWGIPLTKIVHLLLILALTFWFGVFFISGVLFVADPLRIPDDQMQAISQALLQKLPADVVDWFTYLFSDSRPFGVLLLILVALYVITNFVADVLAGGSNRDGRSGSIRFWHWTLPVPPFRLTFYQIGIASADMLVAGSVLWMLFPPIHGGYLAVLEVYLVVYVLIVLSHVPGGWGVLESGMMILLGSLKLVPNPEVNMPKVFAGIIVFRVIYFLLPLAFAASLVGWHEYALRKKWIPPLGAVTAYPADDRADRARGNGKADDSPAARNTKATNPQQRPSSE